jgi:hypothetical protein
MVRTAAQQSDTGTHSGGPATRSAQGTQYPESTTPDNPYRSALSWSRAFFMKLTEMCVTFGIGGLISCQNDGKPAQRSQVGMPGSTYVCGQPKHSFRHYRMLLYGMPRESLDLAAADPAAIPGLGVRPVRIAARGRQYPVSGRASTPTSTSRPDRGCLARRAVAGR